MRGSPMEREKIALSLSLPPTHSFLQPCPWSSRDAHKGMLLQHFGVLRGAVLHEQFEAGNVLVVLVVRVKLVERVEVLAHGTKLPVGLANALENVAKHLSAGAVRRQLQRRQLHAVLNVLRCGVVVVVGGYVSAVPHDMTRRGTGVRGVRRAASATLGQSPAATRSAAHLQVAAKAVVARANEVKHVAVLVPHGQVKGGIAVAVLQTREALK